MVEQRTLLLLLLISSVLLVAVVIAAALGYNTGMLSTPAEKTITTTTSISTTTATTTQTITSSTNVIETSVKTAITTTTFTRIITTTRTVEREQQPLQEHVANSSSALVRGRIFLSGRLLLMVSVDKPVYHIGEPVRLKGTVTNLTPERISLRLWFPSLQVRNSSTEVTYAGSPSVWGHPAGAMVGGLGGQWIGHVELGPGQTATVDEYTADWNMTGIHIERRISQNGGSAWAAYDDHPVPPGQYVAYWYIEINGGDQFLESIPFEITK